MHKNSPWKFLLYVNHHDIIFKVNDLHQYADDTTTVIYKYFNQNEVTEIDSRNNMLK